MKYVISNSVYKRFILPFTSHHDYYFFTLTNVYCFLQQNYSPDFCMSQDPSKTNHVVIPYHGTSYSLKEILLWFMCMFIVWPYGHTRLLRVKCGQQHHTYNCSLRILPNLSLFLRHENKTQYIGVRKQFKWGEIVLYLFKDIAGYISNSGIKWNKSAY